MRVSVDIDEMEVLSDIDSETLRQELRDRRDLPEPGPDVDCPTLLTIYEEFARRGDAPQCLRDYLYAHLGRVLP